MERSRSSEWTGLEIRRTEAGGAADSEGWVEFLASFRQGGEVRGGTETVEEHGPPFYAAKPRPVQAPAPLPPPVPLRVRPRVWNDLARIFSTVCNPFLTSLALFVILAGASSQSTRAFWILLFNSVFFTSIGPMLFVFWLYASDRISDLDMSIREERERIFVAFVLFYALGTVDLWSIGAPRIMTAAMAGSPLRI